MATETVEIQLWKNRRELSDKVTIIDKEDCNKVTEAITARAKWYAWASTSGKHYAMSGCRHKSIHRVVMDNPEGMEVDHINGNPLDNRKENLRICTRAQNSQNKKLRADSKSGYKGVYERSNGRFQAYIGDPDKHGRNIKLGCYDTPEEAARAYDKKAKELHGEYAYLNFPDE